MEVEIIIRYVLLIFSAIVLSSCSSVVENNSIKNIGRKQDTGFFSYRVDMKNPQVLIENIGKFEKEENCILFKTIDGQQVTPIFPYEFVKFNKADNFILMENKVVNLGDKVSVGGYITTPVNYNSYFTKADKSCLLPKVIVLGLGTKVLR